MHKGCITLHSYRSNCWPYSPQTWSHLRPPCPAGQPVHTRPWRLGAPLPAASGWSLHRWWWSRPVVQCIWERWATQATLFAIWLQYEVTEVLPLTCHCSVNTGRLDQMNPTCTNVFTLQWDVTVLLGKGPLNFAMRETNPNVVDQHLVKANWSQGALNDVGDGWCGHDCEDKGEAATSTSWQNNAHLNRAGASFNTSDFICKDIYINCVFWQFVEWGSLLLGATPSDHDSNFLSH